MIKTMKASVQDRDNIVQVFCDTTYHSLKSKSTHFKLWILVGFNKNTYKTVLLCLCLIKNKDEETFTKILEYLKERFNFSPSILTMDFSKSEINAAKKYILILILFYAFFITYKDF